MSKEIDRSSDKFKNREKRFQSVIPKSSLVGIRLDGRAFHAFTKQFARPYDLEFIAAMDATTVFILNKLMKRALLAYTQSDEINIFFTDWIRPRDKMPLNGRVEKILSTTASAATAGFMKSMPKLRGAPIFDAKIFLLEDLYELEEYLEWRRSDSQKNSLMMAAEEIKDPGEIHKLSPEQHMKVLEGTALERMPNGFVWGRMFTRHDYTDTVVFVDGKTKRPRAVNAIRTRWIIEPAIHNVVTDTLKNLEKEISGTHEV